jgi:hypothetical protein
MEVARAFHVCLSKVTQFFLFLVVRISAVSTTARYCTRYVQGHVQARKAIAIMDRAYSNISLHIKHCL